MRLPKYCFADDDITVVTLIENGILAEEFLVKIIVISLVFREIPDVASLLESCEHQPDVVHGWLYQSDIVALYTLLLIAR